MSDHLDVMVSSTSSDLIEHREEAWNALIRLGLFPIGMEFDASKSGKDVIDSSMEMVDKAEVYLGILSHRYGDVPKDAIRNPKKLSITELEYRRALDRRIPVYMFLMSDQHPVLVVGVESVKAKQIKLKALKNDARKRSIAPGFSSALELKNQILQSLSELKSKLERTKTALAPESPGRRAEGDPELPKPPTLLAIPDFVPGHKFVGRDNELATLDQWAASSDPLMVVEAIGGAGKSALAWHWMHRQTTSAGTLWYSFYEGGADMTAFAAYALAYITGRSLKEFRGRRVADLAAELLLELHKQPFLLVLDGFERVLAGYHRFDASQTRDDQVDSAIEHCACTKPEDGDLLFRLVAAAPSKILVTSRLMPAVLAHKTHQHLPGVQHLHLRGMQPDDAIHMMRGLGVHGDELAMRRYFQDNFDNHPLLLGIVAGLVTDYIRDPGNFDRWADDPQGGAALHLATLDLKQRRTHILEIALRGLEPGARQVLSSIAALPDAVVFETVEALSPFKQQPESVPQLIAVLQELERRGLLQWDRRKNTYDLHPVVRSYAFDVLDETQKKAFSNQIVDHFQSRPSDRYENAETIADLQQSINLFRAMVHAGRFDDAARVYCGAFAEALNFSFEAHHLILALLKPLFQDGFQNPPRVVRSRSDQSYLLNVAGTALLWLDRSADAKAAFAVGLRLDLDDGAGLSVCIGLANLAVLYVQTNRNGSFIAARELALEVAQALRDQEQMAGAHLGLMSAYVSSGNFKKAEASHDAFRKLPTPVHRAIYRRGDAELELCWLRLFQGTLTERLLDDAASAAEAGNNALAVRALCGLRGEFALQSDNYPDAIASFGRYIEMTQAIGMSAAKVKSRLALAHAKNGDHEQARRTLDHLTSSGGSLNLAELFLELGDRELARGHALAAYESAWADGPLYSNWWQLKRCRAVLAAVNEPEPQLPAYDPETEEPLRHEEDIRKLIAKLKKDRAPGS